MENKARQPGAKRVITRFAPSPTGTLHLGGARTALFNWLYARHYGGEFHLRIEDTDKERSCQAFSDDILKSLEWMGLAWDGMVIQSQRQDRHREVAHHLLAMGRAYRCFCTPDELTQMRQQAIEQGRPPLYDRRWRDHSGPYPDASPGDRPFAVRLKMPLEGQTCLPDLIQGDVVVDHSTLDDMVILRSDGSATYMLAVVVDDHDMGVTHILRGDDHLTNAFRQIQVYRAMNWDVPVMGHIPLIHSPKGAKLSKRNGDLGLGAYRQMGILPEALCNTLVRLGWGHGNDEKITQAQAIEWFDGSGISKSPARFDPDKMMALNAHYLRMMTVEELETALTLWHVDQTECESAWPGSQPATPEALAGGSAADRFCAGTANGPSPKDPPLHGPSSGESCGVGAPESESSRGIPGLAGANLLGTGVAETDVAGASTPETFPTDLRAQALATSLPRPLPAAARRILPALARRSRTLQDLSQALAAYCQPLLPPGALALTPDQAHLLEPFIQDLASCTEPWHHGDLEAWMRAWTGQQGLGFGALAKALRVGLTGSLVSPGLTDVMVALGPEWTQMRLRQACLLAGQA